MLRWDLDGLCDEELLLSHYKDISFIFYYIIGNLYYGSYLYTRKSMFSSNHEFTTSELIYKYTGIYSIRFSESSEFNFVSIYHTSLDFENLSNSNFNISFLSDITFCGNTDMLVLYGSSIKYANLLHTLRMNLLKLELMDVGELKEPINLNLYLKDYIYCLCEDKHSFFYRLPNVDFVVDIGNIDVFLDYIYNIDFKYPVLEVSDITKLSQMSDFPYELLSNRFNMVYILLTRNYIYRPLNYENIKLLLDELTLKGITNIKFKYKDALVSRVPDTLKSILGDYLVE